MIDTLQGAPAKARDGNRTLATRECWAAAGIHPRLAVVRRLRRLVAEYARELAMAAGEPFHRPLAEKLVSEVLPLAEACRWLEKNAARTLAPRRFGAAGRPLWLHGVAFEVRRQPLGLVLVIGPGNYPLFLPAVHALHGLVAGNAVLLKPAPGSMAVARAFAHLLDEAGLPAGLLTVLPENVDSAREAMARGVDKVVFTGSSENGRDVLARLAETNTPSIMELSGEDPVLVFGDADLEMTVAALRFGTCLNGGATCMAPRRVVAVAEIAEALRTGLAQAGVEMVLEVVADEAAAIEQANAGEYGLGASIFSNDVARALALAGRIAAGFVLINDIIAPTADPRMPFGGIKRSGFGVTRGAEGLLEMTHPQAVMRRGGRARYHFEEAGPGDARLFLSYIRAAHGSRRLAALPAFLRALFDKATHRKTNL